MGPPRTAKRTGETRGNRVVLDPNLKRAGIRRSTPTPNQGRHPPPAPMQLYAFSLFCVHLVCTRPPAPLAGQRRKSSACCTFSCLCVAGQRPHAVHSPVCALHARGHMLYILPCTLHASVQAGFPRHVMIASALFPVRLREVGSFLSSLRCLPTARRCRPSLHTSHTKTGRL